MPPSAFLHALPTVQGRILLAGWLISWSPPSLQSLGTGTREISQEGHKKRLLLPPASTLPVGFGLDESLLPLNRLHRDRQTPLTATGSHQPLTTAGEPSRPPLAHFTFSHNFPLLSQACTECRQAGSTLHNRAFRNNNGSYSLQTASPHPPHWSRVSHARQILHTCLLSYH